MTEILERGIEVDLAGAFPLVWRDAEERPGHENEGRWIVCRFPPQQPENENGRKIWVPATEYRIGEVINGEVGWYPHQDDVEADMGATWQKRYLPSHWAYLHEGGDKNVVLWPKVGKSSIRPER